MPPPSGRTPKAKKPQDYGAVGERGRRTGITLKDTGIRDEHGLEPVPSFQSSPMKSPVKQNGVTNGSYADETMDIGDSTIPEPTDLRRTTRNTNIRFPLPQATTPRKTNLGSSPRRSVGPMPSSAQRGDAETPTRASSHPAPGSKRKLDFSIHDTRSSKERTPQSSGSLKRPRTTKLSGSRVPPKKTFDLNAEDDDAVDETMSVTNGDVTNNDITTNGYDYEDTAMPGVDDDSIQPAPNDDNVEGEDAVGGAVDETINTPEVIEDSQPQRQPLKKGRGRPKRNTGDESILSVPGTPRGRRTKVHRDSDADVEPVAESSKAAEKPQKGSKKAAALKPAPSERGPNAKIIRAPSKVREGKVSRSISRSRFAQRSETPSGQNALITRSGRHSIQPLAHWRGEKAVLSPGNVDKAGRTLGGIKEIIRTEEIIEERPKVRRYGKPRPRPRTPRLEDVEEADEEKEEWELNGGITSASVMQWDSLANHYIEEDKVEQEIAFAANAIEMRDISGAEFRFAKTLTLPFFGSGMVDIPSGGAKRSKNSRKMHMVFFVFYGRVQVEVGTPTKRFGIGKGGMWHVPRGNFYSISNPGKTPARIFFAQGNEVAVGTTAAAGGGGGGDVSS